MAPIDLKQIFNRLYTIQTPEQLLRHLFLEIGTDSAFQSDMAFLNFNLDFPSRQVGTAIQHTMNLVQEGIQCSRSFHSYRVSLRCGGWIEAGGVDSVVHSIIGFIGGLLALALLKRGCGQEKSRNSAG
jgi:hypothetical protein